MKAKALLIAALILSAGINAVAKEDPRNVRVAVVPVKGSDLFKVIYKSESSSRVKINIYNSQAALVFTQTVYGTDGFIRPLNFTGLPAGEYTIEVTDISGKKSEKVVYAPNQNASKKIVHISKVGQNESKYLISIADAKNENVTINFYDKNKTLIFSETRELAGDFAQLYRVKNSGEVTIEVSDAAGTVKSSRF